MSGASARRKVRQAFLWATAIFVFASMAEAADFSTPGGSEPANLEAFTALLRQDSYDLELLISYGTSKGGSAGHLALGVRDEGVGEERVYSANFYADRAPKHAHGFYTEELMIGVPKQEYLFGTVSSLGENASFGLDFGEIYKRSVIGVRVSGVAPEEKAGVVAFFQRLNEDYRQQAKDTEYHDGEIKYDYMRLNCAKTIAAAFRFGAGYSELDIPSAKILKRRRVVVAAKANIPTEMAMKLLREWDRRGYGMEVVFYRKFPASPYIDPKDDEPVAFKDLPNRFPSVLSRDFRREADAYRDFDNLFAMYLLYNMARHSVRVNEQTQLLEIERSKSPLSYREAAELAARDAGHDSRGFLRRLPFMPQGTLIGDAAGQGVSDGVPENGAAQPGR